LKFLTIYKILVNPRLSESDKFSGQQVKQGLIQVLAHSTIS